ncbi:MAG TPA: HD domain-containing phosphohydrolase [Humisphaera sp.]|jgi:putative nucleotidyltransferase with HDIG domain|nr:HD domain-containing phosphohydrolase [Humisphaera sp.]
MSLSPSNLTSMQPTPAIATPLLDAAAARFGAAGLFLVAAFADGTLAYHDSSAGGFFLKYVVPALRQPTIIGAASLLGGAAPALVEIRRSIPGVLLAALPSIDKRHAPIRLYLAARDESFALTEDVLRLCGKLSLDSAWLLQQSRDLPSLNESAMQRQSRLFITVLRDQLRIGGLEAELCSVSEQLAATYEELSLIYQVSGGMKINRSPVEFFKQTCMDVRAVMGARGIGVALRSDAQRQLEPALYGSITLAPDQLARLADDLIRAVAERRGPVLCNALAADRRFDWLAASAGQVLAVPLQRHEQVMGCLYALDKEEGEFDSADAKLLNSIANESAIYLENARMFEDVRGLMMGLMHSLTSAVDAKDAYTCGHSERVALLSRHVAKELGISDSEVEQIYIAGLLHDVGKIGVPESVLQKTGKLTNEEFDLMKKHPEIGAKILQDVRQIQQIIPGVLHHHERYDGNGYPARLAGEDIPLMGRIICLADCFDAMTTNRTYRRALPIEVALAEIRRCAGTQFDPRLAEVFLRTSADRYRELLRDHQQQSKRILDVRESLIAK